METLEIAGIPKKGRHFTEVLGLLCDLDDLANRFQGALGLEKRRCGDEGYVSDGDPIPLNDKAKETLYYHDIIINGSDDVFPGTLESWKRLPSRNFHFSMSVRMSVDDLSACGINFTERTGVHLRGDTDLYVMFEGHTAGRRTTQFDVTLVSYSDGSD